MKCPKCQYIGFESADRCRNCGYDFSLAPRADPGADLPLRGNQPMGPLSDFDLRDARGPQASPDAGGAGANRPTPREGTELPLFGDAARDDAPLVRPVGQDAPLSVRRSTPAAARTRPAAGAAPRAIEPPPDPGLPLDSGSDRAEDRAGATRDALDGRTVGMGPRAVAAALDWLLLLALDVGVVYFTLRVSRLANAEVLLLPAAPLASFLVLLNAGYLVLFTAANGQTIGKMALGIKVVSAEDHPVSVGRAVVRVLAYLVTVLPGGLGLVPAAFDGARRGIHDRLAGTRVVRTAAS